MRLSRINLAMIILNATQASQAHSTVVKKKPILLCVDPVSRDLNSWENNHPNDDWRGKGNRRKPRVK